MAGRAVEGFETRQHATYFTRLYPVASVGSIGFTTGRRHGSALTSTSASFRTDALVSSVENTWIVCFAVKVSDNAVVIPSGATGGVRLYDSVGEQIALVLQPGAAHNTWNLELRRGATVLATTADYSCGSQQAWQYFQWKVTVRTGTNGTSELRRWGYQDSTHEVVHNLSSLNTANQGTDGADRFEAVCNAGGTSQMQLDDIVVMDNTGTANNDFTTNPLVVIGALPDGEGNTQDWTPDTGSAHFSRVDDPVGLPADTELVRSATVGDIDQFTYQDLTVLVGGSSAVAMVQIVTTAGMLASGSQDLAVSVRSGATDTQGSDFTVSGIPIGSFREVFDENPVGPAAWTKTSLEAAEFGVEVRP